MRRHSYKKYVILASTLLVLLILPTTWLAPLRSGCVALLSPLCSLGATRSPEKEALLESENLLLRNEISKWRALMEQQDYDPATTVVAAQVIYRDPTSWSSALWIDVGSDHSPVVQKNSPVILGRAVVGLVDYVGNKQSRVRLITDAALNASVRAVRGHLQNRVLLEHIHPLLRHMVVRKDLPLSKEELMTLGQLLTQLQERLSEGAEACYLAKGIVHGSGTPLWRSLKPTLRGVGFNYDFPDSQGPARELLSGKPLDIKASTPALPIIKLHDLLVTTGLDGVFPPNLLVAEVTKIFPLHEGAYTYELEAAPVAGNLDALKTLFVIPPVAYNAEGEAP